jgi:hypothetical protein
VLPDAHMKDWAKATLLFISSCGTAKAEPFQIIALCRGSLADGQHPLLGEWSSGVHRRVGLEATGHVYLTGLSTGSKSHSQG